IQYFTAQRSRWQHSTALLVVSYVTQIDFMVWMNCKKSSSQERCHNNTELNMLPFWL
ncbi:Cytochrome P450 monooxygenase aclC, partial [Dissostichus eleginoides]